MACSAIAAEKGDPPVGESSREDLPPAAGLALDLPTGPQVHCSINWITSSPTVALPHFPSTGYSQRFFAAKWPSV